MNKDRNIPADITPVHLLSGFLGSGKTTLLALMLERFQNEGLKAAVLMNEIGDVNLDGQLLDEEVPLAEVLSGCICCSMRGSLGLELGNLLEEHKPDVIIIESTGAANPMETIDGVTDAAITYGIDLRSIATVVDGPELLTRSRLGKSRTYRLMKEQIRCASMLLLNKSDRLQPDELAEAQQLLRELNAHAPIVPTIRCRMDDWSWLEPAGRPSAGVASGTAPQPGVSEGDEQERCKGKDFEAHDHASPSCSAGHDHAPLLCSADELHPVGHGHAPSAGPEGHHHTHSHVMALTHYWRKPIDSRAFEALLNSLPDNVYRAKGVVSFTDLPSRFLFQYAYKESDFVRVEPREGTRDVAVFIGEHFDKDALLRELLRLENESRYE